MSVKAKITFWYAASLLVILALVLVFLLSVGGMQARRDLEATLISTVELEAVRVEIDDYDGPDDDDLLDPRVYPVTENVLVELEDVTFYQNSAYIAVYYNGFILDGVLPQGITLPAPAGNGLSVHGNWLVYDLATSDEGVTVYVRGCADLTTATNTFSSLLGLAFIALPIILCVALIGGYLITKRSFGLVKRIVQTADSIAESGDLSRRIGAGQSNDELHVLANAFDRMFDRIEESFQKEKQFTSDASHELRTPTAVIIAQSEYALEHEEAREHALQVIFSQAKKMSAMLSQLLMLARADRGTQKLNREQLDLSELTDIIVQQQAELAEARHITFESDLEPEVRVCADETLIMRVLINLTDNAVRYGKDGGKIKVALHRMGNRAVVSVQDDGIGISEENQKKVWERFYQADPSHGGEGSGLGLSMVKWIVEAHGGSVWLESELGKGSTFCFSLELCPQDKNKEE